MVKNTAEILMAVVLSGFSGSVREQKFENGCLGSV